MHEVELQNTEVQSLQRPGNSGTISFSVKISGT